MRRVVNQLWRHRRANLLAITLSALLIAVIYSLGALSDNAAIAAAAADAIQVSEVIPAGLTLVELLLIAFTVAFQLYLARALAARRRREFGMARLLGLSANRLGLRLIGESLLRQVVALVAGLIAGVLVSKLLAMAMVRLMGLRVATGLLFAPRTMVELTVTFLAVAAVAGALEAVAIRGRDLTPWLMARPPEPTQARGTRFGRAKAVIGWLLVIGGWVISLTFASLRQAMRLAHWSWAGAALMLVMITAWLVGTYWLLRASLPGLLGWWIKRRGFHQALARQLALTQVRERLIGNAHSLWLTTVLAGVTMTVLGSASMIYGVAVDTMNRAVVAPIVATGAARAQVPRDFVLTSQVDLPTKLVVGQLAGTTKRVNLYQAIALSDYRRLRRLQATLPAVSLRGSQAVVLTSSIGALRRRHLLRGRRPLLTLRRGGGRYTVTEISAHFPLGEDAFFDRGVVVSDARYRQLTGPVDTLSGFWPRASAATTAALERGYRGADRVAFVADTAAVRAGRQAPKIRSTSRYSAWSRTLVAYRQPVRAAGQTLFGFGLFLALTAGMVVVIATASILLLKLVVAAETTSADLAVLAALGLPAHQRSALIWRTTLTMFAVPLSLAIADTVAMMHLAHTAFDEQVGWLAVVVVGLYALIFMAFAGYTGRLIHRLSAVNGPA